MHDLIRDIAFRIVFVYSESRGGAILLAAGGRLRGPCLPGLRRTGATAERRPVSEQPGRAAPFQAGSVA